MCVGSNWLRAGGKSASLDDSVRYITPWLFSSVEEIYAQTIFVTPILNACRILLFRISVFLLL